MTNQQIDQVKQQRETAILDVIRTAHLVAKNFIMKVETGQARSTETYNDMKILLWKIEALQSIK